MKLPFVKGHMGGNRILLLPGIDGTDQELLDMGLKLLDHLYLCGHQAGFLYAGSDNGAFRVRIICYTARDFLSACGGLTQVFGAAVKEGYLESVLGLPSVEQDEILLETDGGPVLIRIENGPDGSLRVFTDMTGFAEECMRQGVEKLSLDGVEALRSGAFLVVDAKKAALKGGPGDFVTLDAEARKALISLQKRFRNVCNTNSRNFALYDHGPSGDGPIRAVFPHGIERGHIEPACGTGSVALALGLLETGELSGQVRDGTIATDLETGGGPCLGGDEKTRVEFEYSGGTLKKARFSHSRVEILAMGEVSI